MEIIHTTAITLEKAEIAALQTIKDAYMQCVIDDNIECEQCPLWVNDLCCGMLAEMVLDKQKCR